MTVEELMILISASADEALAAISAVDTGISQLIATAEGRPIAINADGAQALGQITGVGQAVTAATTTTEAALRQAAGVAEAVAPVMQQALDVSKPAQTSIEKMEAFAQAAKKAGEAAESSFKAGDIAAQGFKSTLSKVGGGLLQGIVSGGTMALVTLAISGVSALADALIHAKENAEKAAEAERQKHRETATAMEQERAGLNKLASQYEALAGKTGRTAEETQQMYQIQAQLRSEYGITETSVKGLAGTYTDLAAAIKAAKEASAAQSTEALAAVANDTGNEALKKAQQIFDDWQQTKADFADAIETEKNSLAQSGVTSSKILEDLQASLKAAEDKAKNDIAATSGDFTNWFIALSALNAAAVEAAGGEWNNAVAAALTKAFDIDPSLSGDPTALANYVYASANALMVAASSPDFQAALDEATAMHERIVAGYAPTEDDYAAVEDSYATMREIVAKALREIPGTVVDAGGEQVSEVLASMNVPVEALAGSWQELNTALRNAKLADANKQLQAVTDSLKKQNNVLDNNSALANNISQWKQLYVAYQNATAGSEQQRQSFQRLQAIASQFGITLDNSATSLDNANNAIGGVAAGRLSEVIAF